MAANRAAAPGEDDGAGADAAVAGAAALVAGALAAHRERGAP
jgi:hypothetical protein